MTSVNIPEADIKNRLRHADAYIANIVTNVWHGVPVSIGHMID